MKKIIFGAILGSLATAATACVLELVKKKRATADDVPEYVTNVSAQSAFSRDDLIKEHSDGEALPSMMRMTEFSIKEAGMTISLSASGKRTATASSGESDSSNSLWWPKEGKFRISIAKSNLDERQNKIFYWLLFFEDKTAGESYFSMLEIQENKTVLLQPKYVVALNQSLEVQEITARDLYRSSPRLHHGLYGERVAAVARGRVNDDGAPISKLAFYGSDDARRVVVYDALNGKSKFLDWESKDFIGYVGLEERIGFDIVALFKSSNGTYIYQQLGDPGSGHRPRFYKDKVSEYNPARFLEACQNNGGKAPEAYYEETKPGSWD